MEWVALGESRKPCAEGLRNRVGNCCPARHIYRWLGERGKSACLWSPFYV